MSSRLTNTIWQIKLPPAEKLVYLALSWRDSEIHGCFPSKGTLADMTGLSRATVTRAISNLKRKGLLSVQTNKGAASSYTLTPLAKQEAAEGLLKLIKNAGNRAENPAHGEPTKAAHGEPGVGSSSTKTRLMVSRRYNKIEIDRAGAVKNGLPENRKGTQSYADWKAASEAAAARSAGGDPEQQSGKAAT